MRLLKGVKVPLYSCSLVQTEAEEDAESCRIEELDRGEVTLFVYLLRPRKPISGGTLYLNPAGWVGLTPLCPVFTALYCPDSYQVPSLRGDGSMDQTRRTHCTKRQHTQSAIVADLLLVMHLM